MSRYAGVACCVIVMLGVGLLTACHHDSESKVSYTPQQLAAIRADFQRDNPNARVGVVSGVAEDVKLATVGQVSPRDFRMNDVVTFIDADGRILTSGSVVGTAGSDLQVRYSRPRGDGRVPRVGDLAVRAIQ